MLIFFTKTIDKEKAHMYNGVVKKINKKKVGDKMEVNIENLKKLIKEKFKNNKTRFAETLGISREYISKLLNGREDKTSAKICNAIILYCESNNLDYRKYIFLP